MADTSGKVSIALITLIAASALTACSPRSDTPQEPATAASTAPISESADGVATFTIGELQALALRDGTLEFPNDNKIIGVGRTPADVGALLSSAGLPVESLQLSIQPLLVRANDRVLLFDTGAGTSFGPGAGQLAASLAAADVDPQSVTDVFVSHAHGDHVGGLLTAQGEPAFPNATIHISAPEWAFLKGLNAETGASLGLGRYTALLAAMTPGVSEFAPGAELIPGVVKAVEIRGHTPGHSGYLITSGGSSLLYIGDAMHHFVVSVQKPDWTIQFDSDAPTSQASRSDLLAQSAQSGQRIYAVHFPFPGVGKVERRGEEFVWVAE